MPNYYLQTSCEQKITLKTPTIGFVNEILITAKWTPHNCVGAI
jgi:hypothetical protein